MLSSILNSFKCWMSSQLRSNIQKTVVLTQSEEPKIIRYDDPLKTWQRAKEEVDSGDPAQGGEKGWLALDIALNENSRAGKFYLKNHRVKNAFMRIYQSEYGKIHGHEKKEEIRLKYESAQGLHSNFYDGHMLEDEVKDSLNDVKFLIETLKQFQMSTEAYIKLERRCDNMGLDRTEDLNGIIIYRTKGEKKNTEKK